MIIMTKGEIAHHHYFLQLPNSIINLIKQRFTFTSHSQEHSLSFFTNYLPLDGMVNIPIYLVWASRVRNETTFLSDNRYFEIQI